MFQDMLTLYVKRQYEVDVGFCIISTTETKITLGFRPRYIAFGKNDATNMHSFIYDETISNAKFRVTSTTSSSTYAAIGAGNVCLVSISDDGFTVKAASATYAGEFHYFAVG